jgi:hypothetical protein
MCSTAVCCMLGVLQQGQQRQHLCFKMKESHSPWLPGCCRVVTREGGVAGGRGDDVRQAAGWDGSVIGARSAGGRASGRLVK